MDQEYELKRCKDVLAYLVREANLPDLAKEKILLQFSDRVFKTSELFMALDEAKI